MRRWRATFDGREVGAIGVTSRHVIEVEGIDEGAAHLAIYETHEHISRLELAEVECSRCGGPGPSHVGSRSCECGSIASGGTREHCSCEACY